MKVCWYTHCTAVHVHLDVLLSVHVIVPPGAEGTRGESTPGAARHMRAGVCDVQAPVDPHPGDSSSLRGLVVLHAGCCIWAHQLKLCASG